MLPVAPPPAVIVEPDWVRKPTGAELGDAYPSVANRHGIPGRAVVKCRVAVSGAPTGCELVEESPAGLGFGEAGLRMTQTFRFTPQTRDGVPTDNGEVTIPLNFANPAAHAALPPGPGQPAFFVRPAVAGELVPTARSVPCDRVGMTGGACVMTPLPWDAAPGAGALAGLYGAVMLGCKLDAHGAPKDCRGEAQSPGAHVDAAKYHARDFKAPPVVEGRSTEGSAVIFVLAPPGPDR